MDAVLQLGTAPRPGFSIDHMIMTSWNLKQLAGLKLQLLMAGKWEQALITQRPCDSIKQECVVETFQGCSRALKCNRTHVTDILEKWASEKTYKAV